MRWITGSALLLSLAWPTVARTEGVLSPPGSFSANAIGILSIESSGVSEAAGEEFERRFEETLEGLGKQVVKRSALRKALRGSDFLESCLFGPCLRELLKTTGLKRVLVVRIHGEGSSYSFVITLVDTQTGMHDVQTSEICSVCTIGEAISTAATLSTVDLINRAENSDAAPRYLAGNAPSKRAPSKSSAVRRAGLIFIGAGVAANVIGGIVWQDGNSVWGAPSLATGTTLMGTGLTMMLLSRRF